MKITNFTLTFILSVCTIFLSLHSELLIVKKTETGFAPLTTEETINSGPQIAEILLEYQWPMCIASELNQKEQDALLSPDKPYAEELFIENKIQELGENFEKYSVIFVPTAIYELFCVIQTYTLREQREQKIPLQAAQTILSSAHRRLEAKWYIDLLPILNANNSAYVARKAIYAMYKNLNKQFFNTTPQHESPWFYINNKLASFLFEQYPTFKDSPDGLSLSKEIKQKSDELSKTCIKNLISLPIFSKRDLSTAKTSVSMLNLPANLQDETENKIVASTIALEYEARELNKALLLRGTSFEQLQVEPGIQPKKTLLAGSTLKTQSHQFGYSFEQIYRHERNIPYSISFSNSLFSGILNDLKASAYYYLVGKPGRFPTEFRAAGYALLIDKQAYYQHQNQNLFFIPPLASLASLFQAGEYFHPRTKAAIALKDPRQIIYVKGLDTKQAVKDLTGVLLITRDPLHHAELFSIFLADNGRIIQRGDDSTLTDEEKKFFETIQESQRKAAKFYRAVRIITPKIQQSMQQFKQKHSTQSAVTAT